MEVHCVRFRYHVIKIGSTNMVGVCQLGVEYITLNLLKRPLLCMFPWTSLDDLSLERRDDI